MAIERSVDEARLGWPGPQRLLGGERLGGNREYVDVTGMPVAEGMEVLVEERALLDRIAAAEDPGEEHEAIVEELSDDPGLLYLIDVGVASTVAALSCIGCVPFASCNGGVFGDHHHEEHPLVVFYARRGHVPVLLAAAEAADVGLENDGSGGLIVYADGVEPMHSFASSLLNAAVAGLAGRGSPGGRAKP